MRAMFNLVLAALFAMSPVMVSAAEFNDAQKKEMGSIIQEYLMENPEVLRDALIELQKREENLAAAAQGEALKAAADGLYRSAGDFALGNPKASVAIVEFFDYNCGYCKKSYPDVRKLAEVDKDIRIVLKEFPILGPGSVVAAKAAIAARKQGKYWELHQAYMEFQGQKDEKTALAIAAKVGLDMAQLEKDMNDPQVIEIISQNREIANALGIQGTPAFVAGETLIPGAVGYDGLASLIKDIRDKGGCKVC